MDYVEMYLTWTCLIGFMVYKWWYRWHYHQHVSRQYDLFLNVYFFGAMFFFVGCLSPQFHIYERLTLPFTWAGIFLITTIVSNIQHRRWRRVAQTAVIIGALVYALTLITTGNHQILFYDVIS